MGWGDSGILVSNSREQENIGVTDDFGAVGLSDNVDLDFDRVVGWDSVENGFLGEAGPVFGASKITIFIEDNVLARVFCGIAAEIMFLIVDLIGSPLEGLIFTSPVLVIACPCDEGEGKDNNKTLGEHF